MIGETVVGTRVMLYAYYPSALPCLSFRMPIRIQKCVYYLFSVEELLNMLPGAGAGAGAGAANALETITTMANAKLHKKRIFIQSNYF